MLNANETTKRQSMRRSSRGTSRRSGISINSAPEGLNDRLQTLKRIQMLDQMARGENAVYESSENSCFDLKAKTKILPP